MANSICHFVEKEMREGLGGKKDWTITKHMAGRITYDYEWDYEDLTLNGILLNCEVDWTGHMNGAREILPVENIPFADLAREVRIHPSYSSGDGFMLTRCVQYAAAHLEKNFFFPRDFAYLAQNLDDDRELTTEHLDAASITRWKNKQTWGWDKIRRSKLSKRRKTLTMRLPRSTLACRKTSTRSLLTFTTLLAFSTTSSPARRTRLRPPSTLMLLVVTIPPRVAENPAYQKPTHALHHNNVIIYQETLKLSETTLRTLALVLTYPLLLLSSIALTILYLIVNA
jgi:hypothetical protein